MSEWRQRLTADEDKEADALDRIIAAGREAARKLSLIRNRAVKRMSRQALTSSVQSSKSGDSKEISNVHQQAD